MRSFSTISAELVGLLMSASAQKLKDRARSIALDQNPRIMRYELADYEWVAIKPMLPNKPRGVPQVNDRRVFIVHAVFEGLSN
jgi:hypothetical protein